MYFNKTSSEVYSNGSYQVQGHFELLDLIPSDYILFAWGEDIIHDDFQTSSYRFIPLDDEHAYVRSESKFWIENVNETHHPPHMPQIGGNHVR